MITLVPNIYLLEYLNGTGRVEPKLEEQVSILIFLKVLISFDIFKEFNKQFEVIKSSNLIHVYKFPNFVCILKFSIDQGAFVCKTFLSTE